MGFWILTEYEVAVNSCVPKEGYLPASSRLFHLIWLPIAYRSVSMSHTVNTTWISSVDFKLGQNTSSRADRYSIIYVPVDLAITIAQSQRHQSVSSCEKIQTRKSNVFFEKNCGGHRNVQEFSKLTLFLNFDFFCFKKYHFMLPKFLERALLLPKMMP